MNLYIVLYHHRHGVTPCLVKSTKEPSREQVISALTDMGEEVELDTGEDEHFEVVLSGPAYVPADVPSTNSKDCDSAGCPGWAVFNGNEIQRCDTCKRFDDDDEAIAHVSALEALDWGQHFDVAAHKALVELRDELSALIESTQSYRASTEMTEVINRLETLLGRSFWLERHRWSEHGLQFARLLSELYAIGEPSEDTETMEDPGYFSVKIKELALSMDTSWTEILSIMERADAVFQSEKRPPEVRS